MKRKRIDWLQLIAAAPITLVVIVVGGMILYYIQSEKPKLVFERPETLPFTATTGRNFAIYNVSFANSGRAATTDVVGIMQVPGALIEQFGIDVHPALGWTHNVLSDTLKIQLTEIAPGETVRASFLATSSNTLPNTPEVSARGPEGVIAEERSTVKSVQFGSLATMIWAGVGIWTVGAIVGVGASKRVKKRVNKLIGTQPELDHDLRQSVSSDAHKQSAPSGDRS